jgi:hypothetical protein
MWESGWRRPFFPSFPRRWKSIGAIKIKNGPPLFSEGDEGGGAGNNVGKWVAKALLSVIPAQAEIHRCDKNKEWPPAFQRG